jgi:hypothetical protein
MYRYGPKKKTTKNQQRATQTETEAEAIPKAKRG